MRLISFGMVLLCTGLTSARGEKNTDLPKLLCRPGALVYQNSFENAKLDAQWTVERGAWGVSHGSLIGRELAADENSASIIFDEPNRDSLLRFSFMFDGGESFNLALTRDKNGGHLVRVYITPHDLKVRIARDGRNPDSRAKTLGHIEGRFEKSQWYTLQVELRFRV